MSNWLNQLYFKKLNKALENISMGSIILTTPDGKTHHYAGKESGPNADLKIIDWRVIPALSAKGDIGLTLAYREGWWDSKSLVDLFTFAIENHNTLAKWTHGNVFSQMSARVVYALRQNSIKGSKRNIPAHYDLSNAFYQLWLDESMTYSSALFESEHETLSQAQLNKYDRLLERIPQQTGTLLEIGCGWGGLAERAVDRFDVEITGLTLSPSQYHYANNRLEDRSKQAQFKLRDYRHQEGKFDNIISIEMFEAVGEKYWQTYFNKVKSLLKPKGRAQIQTITIEDSRFEDYKKRGDMFRTFIFPGGMLPSVDRFQSVAKSCGLQMTHLFDFGLDYATTCEHWLTRFEDSLDQVRELGFDEAFIKTWRYYLSACIAGFRVKRTSVIQAELCHA